MFTSVFLATIQQGLYFHLVVQYVVLNIKCIHFSGIFVHNVDAVILSQCNP